MRVVTRRVDAVSEDLGMHCPELRSGRSRHPRSSPTEPGLPRPDLSIVAQRLLAGAAAWALLVSSAASAAPRSYDIHFTPSLSPTAVGYRLHVGRESGVYSHTADIGRPDSAGEAAVYRVTMEETLEVYIALSSYDELGRSSSLSNEMYFDGGSIVVSEVPPSPEPPPSEEPPPSQEPDPPAVPPVPPAPGERTPGQIAVWTTDLDTLAEIDAGGRETDLMLDLLDSEHDLRPSSCDLDGDGDQDLVLGFGPGSAGELILVHRENGVLARQSSLFVGDPPYRDLDGQTRPACGDVDGDGRVEIVVGLGPSAEGELKVLDDESTGYAPFDLPDDPGGRLIVPMPNGVGAGAAATSPALGDIDGDGRDELIVGFEAPGVNEIAILDDGASGFAAHPSVGGPSPFYRVAGARDPGAMGGHTRPATGDYDADGIDEIVVGFGPGSGGWIALLEDTQASSFARRRGFLMFLVGRPDYRSRSGSTWPRLGNIDEDPGAEIIVGFEGAGSHELEIVEDLSSVRIWAMLGLNGRFVSATESTRVLHPAPAE